MSTGLCVPEPPAPMEPVPWPAAFDAPGWLWQTKLDGVRCLAVHDPGDARQPVRLWSRRGLQRSERYPEIARALPAAVGAGAAVLDGELAVSDSDGRPSFHLVMRRAMTAAPSPALVAALPVHLHVFDALCLDGRDLRALPLVERLEAVRASIRPQEAISVVAAQQDGLSAFARAERLGLEGVVGKREDSLYRPGPQASWRKVKPRRAIRARVVGAAWSPEGRLRALALAVAVAGRPVYVGDVGSGLSEAVRTALARWLRAAPPAEPPDAAPPVRRSALRTWVRAGLTADVTYAELTPDGRLRAPALAGLRTDGAPDGPSPALDARGREGVAFAENP